MRKHKHQSKNTNTNTNINISVVKTRKLPTFIGKINSNTTATTTTAISTTRNTCNSFQMIMIPLMRVAQWCVNTNLISFGNKTKFVTPCFIINTLLRATFFYQEKLSLISFRRYYLGTCSPV